MNPEEIKKQAKKIMDDFVSALGEVKKEGEFFVQRKENIRTEEVMKTDEEFRELMLKNAPHIKDDCILAEKKKW